jgi:serine/threonine-protein kinase
MGICPSCSRDVPEGNRFCGSCGSLLDIPTSAPTATSLESDPTPVSHPSLDEGRFVPGTVLARRYRIVGLLGRGGMGEVYRADDLKLGRPVALKFLPQAVEGDRARFDRLLNEVRVALKVTHPNVCRVHDIGEVGPSTPSGPGQHYLSMEYVDGEDLTSLLRRIGRLPQDKAVQMARQLCAGLAAAHDQGILHRDLKPANVMIDGRGQVKITDFGLAGLVGEFEGAEIRAGTPLYMSPEQLAEREVTVRSDIYSLGLVLYELFTGKSAFEGRTPAEIARRRETAPTSLSTIITDINPAVERIILRCLESDPQHRPRSALAVAAALPGGDPLAAALAAGETPSPELIAEAGQSGGLKPPWALSLLVASLVAVGVLIALSSEMMLVRRAALDKSPDVLADRAREVVAEAGWTDPPADSLCGFLPNWDYYEHLSESGPAPERWSVIEKAQPAMLRFGYRRSPQLLVRHHAGTIGDWFEDPPPTLPGMVEVKLDAEGRLIEFLAVPPHEIRPDVIEGEPDWDPLFEAAGLDRHNLESVESLWAPPSYANRRAAWEGVYPEATDTPIRIEAAAYGELPVAFRIVEPWTQSQDAEVDTRGVLARVRDLLNTVLFVVALVAASVLAFRNVRLGRGDRRTALRFALYLGAVRMVWLLGAHHLPSNDEVMILNGHLAWALFRVGVVYVFYLALEPYARRLWPRMLVSWVRLISGRLRDPLVGRDLLIGVAYGAGSAIVIQLIGWIPRTLGIDDYGLHTETWSWESLTGLRHAISAIAALHTIAALTVFTGVILILVLRVLVRKTWIAVSVASVLFLAFYLPSYGHLLPYVVGMLVAMALFWIVLFRIGLLAIFVGATVRDLLLYLPLTFDLGAWYAEVTLVAVAIVAGLAAWGFWVSLAGRPLFRDEILEPGSPR